MSELRTPMPERDFQSLNRALAVLSVVLLVVAAVSSLRVDDDSYQHYARSVVQLETLAWRTWVTDIWNKPIIAIVYGIPGLLGIVAARWASVLATVVTAYFTSRISSVVVVGDTKLAPWIPVILFATQFAVLSDAFVTMTEVPAACAVALSLWLLFVKHRPRLSAAAAGFIPLCRVELLPITLFIGAWLTIDSVKRARTSAAPDRGSRFAPALDHALPIMLTLAPFCIWWSAGALVSGDISWFSRASYTYPRSWDLGGILHYNVLNGLAKVAPPPTLFFLFLGIIYASDRCRASSQRWQLSLLFGVLLIHYALLNTLVVLPKGSHGFPDGHAVAAINARNYTPTAPIATIFASFGVAGFVDSVRLGRLNLWKPLVAVLLALFAISTGLRMPTSEILYKLALLAASTLILFAVARRAHNGKPAAATALAGLTVLWVSLAVRPFFWYPTRWNDRREASVRALARLVTTERPPRVVQDLAASLGMYSGNNDLDAIWTYPQSYLERLRDAPDGTLVVLRTGSDGLPHPRYPHTLVRALTDGVSTARVEVLQRYTDERRPAYLYVLDDVAAKRDNESWIAYRVLGSVAERPFVK
jgi:hypothetical protein